MPSVQETDSGSYKVTGSTRWTLTHPDAETLNIDLLQGSRIDKSTKGYSIIGYSPTALPTDKDWSKVSNLAYQSTSTQSSSTSVKANFSADSIVIPASAIVKRT